MKFKIKLADILIIIIAASLTFFSAYSAYVKPSDKLRALVRGESGEWSFPIEAKETLVVKGQLGDTVIKIEGKRAWVESSPCANKTCITTGHISKQGQWSACLPNKVLLLIEGKDDDIDTVSW